VVQKEGGAAIHCKSQMSHISQGCTATSHDQNTMKSLIMTLLHQYCRSRSATDIILAILKLFLHFSPHVFLLSCNLLRFANYIINLCMYVCMYVCMHACTYVCIFTYVRTYVCMYIRTTYVCIM